MNQAWVLPALGVVTAVLGAIVVGVVAALRRQRREIEALRESESQYLSMLGAMDDLVFVLDADARFSSTFTPHGPLIMRPETFIGKTAAEVLPPHVATLITEGLASTQEGQTVEFEYDLDMPEGSRRYAARLAPVMRDGAPMGTLAVVRDNTEQRRSQEALRTEKAFTDTALDRQMDTFFLFDSATGQALRWNKAFRDISGYTDAEIAALPAPASYYGPADLGRASAFIEKVKTEGSGTIELELLCKSGLRVPTEYRVSAIHDGEGQTTQFISIGRDVTERRRIEAELTRHREHLEALVSERTAELRQVVGLMSGREVRMAELKEVIRCLREQLLAAGLDPVADDPLLSSPPPHQEVPHI